MKKEFATITTLRLDCLHKDKLERIINAQLGVSAKTQAGAIRQMIGKWEPLIGDMNRLKSDNQQLRQENRQFMEVIESYVSVTREMQALSERNRRLPKTPDVARCSVAGGLHKARESN